jgi:hypothetical protein
MKPKKKSKGPPRTRLKPITLVPLTPEQALRAFMEADPAKVEERLRQDGVSKG